MKNRIAKDKSPLVLGLLGALVVLVMAVLQGANAQTPVQATAGTGSLTALTASGKSLDCPLEHTDVQISVSGFLARATVTQSFHNPFNERIEAIYIFPLGAQAAVDDMTMRIGNRTIKGLIMERAEATRIYEQARQNGQTASLLTQERPNIFTQAVANILPGENIEIEISYVEYLTYEKGTLSMAFPMVVGPRFIPGATVKADGDVEQVSRNTNPVFDADRINPPVMPNGMRAGHDISIAVEIDAGVPFKNLRSPSHSIATDRIGSSSAIVRLDSRDRIPNKDFILKWDVDPARVETGFLANSNDGKGFFTLMLVPSVRPRAEDVTPKEMVFVLDCSGSMSGQPMEQAKTLVRHALANMNPEDSFSIIRFSENASALGPRPLPNTPANVKKGIAYINSLHGMGGTMMIEGIKAALDFPKDENRLRIVMFLTDGYIGNDDEILNAIGEHIGDTRLFSFGVGSSTNRYLLENMAVEGRGTAQFVRYDEDPTPVVASFYDSIRSPMLTHVQLDWDGLEISDVYPRLIPDVYAGHPVQITGRFSKPGNGVIKITGKMGGAEITFPVHVSLPRNESSNDVLRALWARRAIEDRTRAMLRGETEELVAEVTRISIENRVLSAYTAFVAVEDIVRTNEHGDPVKVEVPVEIPDGVSYEGIFGAMAEEKMEVAGRKMLAVQKSPAMSRTLAISQLPTPIAIAEAGPTPTRAFSGIRSVGGSGRSNLADNDKTCLKNRGAAVKESSLDEAELEVGIVTFVRVLGLSQADIERQLRIWKKKVRSCLKTSSKGNKLGIITIEFVVDNSGKVLTMKFGTEGQFDGRQIKCLSKMLKKLRFAGPGSATVEIDLED